MTRAVTSRVQFPHSNRSPSPAPRSGPNSNIDKGKHPAQRLLSGATIEIELVFVGQVRGVVVREEQAVDLDVQHLQFAHQSYGLRRKRIAVAAGNEAGWESRCDVAGHRRESETLVVEEISRPRIGPEHRSQKPPILAV